MDLTDRQKEIVMNSIRIIAQQGIQDLTIKNIAAAIHVTEAALYRHFKSKNEILMAVLDYFAEVSNRILETVEREGTSPLQKIELFLMNRYLLFLENPDLAKVMFSDVLFENDPELSARMLSIIQTHMHELQGYVKQSQEQSLIRNDLDFMHLFRIIVGSMRLLVTQWCLSEYCFQLMEEGKRQWETVKTLLR